MSMSKKSLKNLIFIAAVLVILTRLTLTSSLAHAGNDPESDFRQMVSFLKTAKFADCKIQVSESSFQIEKGQDIDSMSLYGVKPYTRVSSSTNANSSAFHYCLRTNNPNPSVGQEYSQCLNILVKGRNPSWYAVEISVYRDLDTTGHSTSIVCSKPIKHF